MQFLRDHEAKIATKYETRGSFLTVSLSQQGENFVNHVLFSLKWLKMTFAPLLGLQKS